MTNLTDTTQAVTVADAYERELWKHGTLVHPTLGPYMPIVSIITAAEDEYDLTTQGGNVVRHKSRRVLHYTPHRAPAATERAETDADVVEALRRENEALREVAFKAYALANERDIDGTSNCKLLFDIAWMTYPLTKGERP